MPSIYEDASAIQYARTDLAEGHIGVFRWYLRHNRPWTVVPGDPPRDDLAVEALQPITLKSYRALYDAVGADWLWADRRRMDQKRLARDLGAPGVSVHVLKAAGEAAGYYELDTGRPGVTDLAYFGLMPGYLGQGIGPWLLRQAILHAVRLREAPVTLNTCTLDHPKALDGYLRAGFEIIGTEQDDCYDPRLDGTLPRDIAPHVPLARIA